MLQIGGLDCNWLWLWGYPFSMRFPATLGCGSENLKSSQKPSGSSFWVAQTLLYLEFLGEALSTGLPFFWASSGLHGWMLATLSVMERLWLLLPKPCLSFLKVRITQLCYLCPPPPRFSENPDPKFPYCQLVPFCPWFYCFSITCTNFTFFFSQ